MADVSAAKEAIVQALRQVTEPRAGRDVVTLGYLKSVAYCEGVARVSYELPLPAATAQAQDFLRRATTQALQQIAGIREVHVEFSVAPAATPGILPGVKHVIAVGAGKGGVGKSTVAVLLAVGLKRRGLKVGLLDADVYGPSLPTLTGTVGAEPEIDAHGRVIPPEFEGIKLISMGFLVPPDQAVIWRGPMAQKYVKEFLERGDWGDLDYLIVDLPPGTGDIPLTLAQTIPLTGAVVVCTPQDVALLDAVKALRMYEKLGVQPLGFVENMSYYVCPHCGQREHIFGQDGVVRAAAQLGVPLLGGIPLNASIRVYGDAGRPLANFTEAQADVVQALEHMVTRLVEEVETRARQRKPLPVLRVHD
jgi:ATP-binding protein involved in chromosome partitioning